ncbi:Gfo/Idh/MocA family oxidoreductase [Roseibium sp. M-1]
MSDPKVALVGCGNIGKRHLEALAALEQNIEVDIIEPYAPTRETITAPGHLCIRLFDDVSKLDGEYDLAVVATAANGRRQLLEDLLQERRIPTLLIEKFLFTQTRDYFLFDQCLAASGTVAFVNCGRRGFDSYTKLKEDVGSRNRVSVHLNGAGWNLCSNAIHFVDIIEFVTGQKFVSLVGERVDPEVMPAKRAGLLELTGILDGRLEGGGEVVIECAKGPLMLPTITFDVGGEQWVVNEAAGNVIQLRGGKQISSTAFETRHVSQMPYLYSELIDGRSRLTSYAASAHQHMLLLNALRPKLGLSNENDDPCPIS